MRTLPISVRRAIATELCRARLHQMIKTVLNLYLITKIEDKIVVKRNSQTPLIMYMSTA